MFTFFFRIFFIYCTAPDIVLQYSKKMSFTALALSLFLDNTGGCFFESMAYNQTNS